MEMQIVLTRIKLLINEQFDKAHTVGKAKNYLMITVFSRMYNCGDPI